MTSPWRPRAQSQAHSRERETPEGQRACALRPTPAGAPLGVRPRPWGARGPVQEGQAARHRGGYTKGAFNEAGSTVLLGGGGCAVGLVLSLVMPRVAWTALGRGSRRERRGMVRICALAMVGQLATATQSCGAGGCGVQPMMGCGKAGGDRGLARATRTPARAPVGARPRAPPRASCDAAGDCMCTPGWAPGAHCRAVLAWSRPLEARGAAAVSVKPRVR